LAVICGYQFLLRREVTKHGALGHSSPTGDVGDRRGEAALGELVLGCGEEQPAVACRVGT
jgi:hypothetical protein